MWTSFKNEEKAFKETHFLPFVPEKFQTIGVSLVFFALMLIRYLWQGVKYYPVLDDYIQYFNYRRFGGSLGSIIEDYGLLKARPFAGVMDVTLWSSLWDNLVIALVVISALYLISGLLFKRVFSKYFPVSTVFLVIYLLIPLGFEGTYWLSASTRIVVGLFFVALTAFIFQKFLENNNKWLLIPLFFVQLLSFGFYEQTLVLSLAAVFLIAIIELVISKDTRERMRPLWVFFTVLPLIAFVVITKIQSGSQLYDSRMTLILPWQEGFFQNLNSALMQIRQMFASGTWNILVKGAIRGVKLTAQYGAYIIVALAIILPTGLIFVKNKLSDNRQVIIGLIVGFLLFLAPLTPFFVLENPYMSMRNIVPSFLGLGILADVILSPIIGKTRLYGLLAALMALTFTFSSFSELEDYRYTNEQDNLAAQAVAPYAGSKEKVAVIGLEAYWSAEQNFPYKEHIAGNASSDWAFTGLMMWVKDTNNLQLITPVSAREPWQEWSRDSLDFSTFDRVLYYENGVVLPVEVEKIGEYTFDITLEGKPFGRIYDNEGQGVFEKYEGND